MEIDEKMENEKTAAAAFASMDLSNVFKCVREYCSKWRPEEIEQLEKLLLSAEKMEFPIFPELDTYKNLLLEIELIRLLQKISLVHHENKA